MKEITLGEMQENIRTDKNISKVQLCEGVCTVTALTRYEQDMRVPDKFVIDCLLERLGKNSDKIEFISTDEEFKMSMYRDRIEKKFSQGDFSEVEELLKDYESEIHHAKNLHQQYLLFWRGRLKEIHKEYDKAHKLFQEALACTEREMIVQTGIEKRLLSNIEVEIFYHFAKVYCEIEEREKAVYLLLELKEYLERLERTDEKRIRCFPKVLLELAQEEKRNYNFGLAYSYLKKAEKLAIGEYRIGDLERVLQMQLEIIEKTGASDKDKEEKQDWILALRMVNMTLKDGMITKEGMELWESTANLQLSNIQENI